MRVATPFHRLNITKRARVLSVTLKVGVAQVHWLCVPPGLVKVAETEVKLAAVAPLAPYLTVIRLKKFCATTPFKVKVVLVSCDWMLTIDCPYRTLGDAVP